jgi:hypothetical protein
MSVFTAYFDAAGTEHDQPCLAVAGYVALAEQWIEFERQWAERLKPEGLAYFHATEVRSRWKANQPRLDSLYRDLIKIISDNVLQQFGCCIINRSLAKWSKADRDSWNISAFSMAGRTCASQLRGWTKRQGIQSLPRMIFEDGDSDKGTLLDLLKADGYPVPIFKLKKDAIKKGLVVKAAVPLQAADLLASECFEPMREMEQLGYITGIRWQYEELDKVPGSPKAIMVNNMEHLQKIIAMDRNDEIWLPEGPDDSIVKELFFKK